MGPDTFIWQPHTHMHTYACISMHIHLHTKKYANMPGNKTKSNYKAISRE